MEIGIVEVDGKEVRYLDINVKYMILDEQIDRLNTLVDFYRSYVDDKGEHPFKDWDIETVFDSVMCFGGKHDIDKRLDNEYLRWGVKEETVLEQNKDEVKPEKESEMIKPKREKRKGKVL